MSVASVIRDQIGMGALMSLGAHNFMAGERSLIFNARIIPMNKNGSKRLTAPRIMRVEITLDPSDTYSILVGYLKKFDWVVHYSVENVYNDQLARIMLALDYDGDRVLNPRVL